MHYYLVSPIKIIRADAHSFTYSHPERLPVGALVVIEVGSAQCVGIIMSAVVKPEFTVKEIVQLLDDAPVPLPLVQTALWMSSYYHTYLATVWQTVLPRGLTKKRRHISPRATSPQASRPPTTALTPDQSAAITTIDDMLPGSALLHGVTGSGKTRVYIELARRLMDEGLSSIILVPEIALTSQLVTEFARYFDNIILTHSRQTEAERHVTWQHVINSRDPLIVIGPRSALFMPVQQLGLVVIDECHEPSFKQEQSPRYSALRTAAILARQHEAKLVLGSATPTISDYFLAKTAGRPIIAMPTPARSDAVKPRVSLIDMTKRTNFTQHFFLSDQLLAAITGSLDDGHQALIFHNRRGTAAITLCEQCGWNAGCPRCFVPLTLHADQHQREASQDAGDSMGAERCCDGRRKRQNDDQSSDDEEDDEPRTGAESPRNLRLRGGLARLIRGAGRNHRSLTPPVVYRSSARTPPDSGPGCARRRLRAGQAAPVPRSGPSRRRAR